MFLIPLKKMNRKDDMTLQYVLPANHWLINIHFMEDTSVGVTWLRGKCNLDGEADIHVGLQ